MPCRDVCSFFLPRSRRHTGDVGPSPERLVSSPEAIKAFTGPRSSDASSRTYVMGGASSVAETIADASFDVTEARAENLSFPVDLTSQQGDGDQGRPSVVSSAVAKTSAATMTEAERIERESSSISAVKTEDIRPADHDARAGRPTTYSGISAYSDGRSSYDDKSFTVAVTDQPDPHKVVATTTEICTGSSKVVSTTTEIFTGDHYTSKAPGMQTDGLTTTKQLSPRSRMNEETRQNIPGLQTTTAAAKPSYVYEEALD